MKTTKLWRGIATVLTLALLVCITATPAQAAKPKGYLFKYKGVTVGMHSPAKKLLKKAGKPLATKVTKSCAYKGKDRTYKYKDFILYTYSHTDKGAEYINGITFLTSKVSTKEGIKQGSTLSQMKKKYKKGKEKFGIYTYKKAKSKLQVEVTDGKVTNIRYVGTK